MPENYKSLVIDEIFDVLTMKPIPWPKHLKKTQKIQLVDSVIKYYSTAEGGESYEKCDILFKLKDRIKNGKK